MNRAHTGIAICILATTTIASCSSTPAPVNSEETNTPPIPEIDYPQEAFEPARWGTNAASADDPYLATSSNFVYLNEEALHGIDAKGEPAWEVNIEGTPTDEHSNQLPELRLIDDKTIAVIEEGETAGAGLEESRSIIRVTVVHIQTGEKVGQQDIEGYDDLSEFGVAFPTAGDKAGRPMVTAAAKVKLMPDSKIDLLGGKVNRSLLGSSGGTPIFKLAAVAAKPQSILDSSKPAEESKLQSGFAGTDWNSVETNPKAGPRPRASIAAADNHFVVGTWVSSDKTATEKTSGIINSKSGKLLGTAKCGTTGGNQPLVASPNGKYRVLENLWFDSNGATECYGGGQGQKTVDFTAVADDGTAIGSASGQADGERLLVTAIPGNKAETHPMPEDAYPPIIVMDGDLGLFRDDETGAVSANRLK